MKSHGQLIAYSVGYCREYMGIAWREVYVIHRIRVCFSDMTNQNSIWANLESFQACFMFQVDLANMVARILQAPS